MTKRVLIIGAYGNFGGSIAKVLAREPGIQLIVSGRSLEKAKTYAATLQAENLPQPAALDINKNLEASLAALRPDIVIHTSGPYQSQGYHVAKACIAQDCHYIDLADAREFVAGISALDADAREKGVLVCSGASSVPCLTAALIDHYKPAFERLEKVEYGIATAHLTNRGLATTSAVLSYAGQPFKTLTGGRMKKIYGWQDTRFRKFWGLSVRPLGNCDIPDLDIFPKRYPELEAVRFGAGLELTVLHFGLWILSWLVRLRILSSIQSWAPALLKISWLFNSCGKGDSGFYMTLTGVNERGEPEKRTFDLVARHGDGLYIPSMPAILMAKKLARGEIQAKGAFPCVGFITLEEYLDSLKEFDIQWKDDAPGHVGVICQ